MIGIINRQGSSQEHEIAMDSLQFLLFFAGKLSVSRCLPKIVAGTLVGMGARARRKILFHSA